MVLGLVVDVPVVFLAALVDHSLQRKRNLALEQDQRLVNSNLINYAVEKSSSNVLASATTLHHVARACCTSLHNTY